MLRLIALGLGIALSSAAYGMSDHGVSQAASYEDFSKQFCAAKADAAHIFVVPAAIFSQHKSVKCDGGESQLRMSQPKDDPGHTVFNIDPPKGSKSSLDCDGKADTGMTTVALNCFPVAKETATHPKN